jgi:hypothetical protein
MKKKPSPATFNMNRNYSFFVLSMIICLPVFGDAIPLDGRISQDSFKTEECLKHLPRELLEATDLQFTRKAKVSFLGESFSSGVRGQMKDLLPFSKANEKYLDYYLAKYIRYESVEKVGVANTGVVLDNQEKLEENGCFLLLAKSFYSALKDFDEGHRISRPKIDDDNRNKNEVWKLALKTANNDPSLALKLAGICGHDDVYQGSGGSNDNRFTVPIEKGILNRFVKPAYELCKNQLLKCSVEKVNSSTKLNIPSDDCGVPNEKSCNEYIPKLVSKLSDMMDRKLNYGIPISCPIKVSNLYLPKSFPFDIDDRLKNEIVTSQGQDILFRQVSPPAKYYHQIGSAVITCDLIEKGMSPEEAQNLQILFATAYRNVRICTGRKKDEISFKKVEEVLLNSQDSASLQKINVLRNTDRDLNLAFRSIGVSDDVFEDLKIWNEKLPKIKAYLVANKMYASRTLESADVSEENLSNLLKKEYGASGPGLLKKLKAQVSEGEDFTDILKKKAAEKAGMTVADRNCIFNNLALHQIPSSNLSCPKGTPPEICKLAKKKLKSWDVDIDWTRSAQKAGAEFSRSVCKPKKIDLNESSCEALKKI